MKKWLLSLLSAVVLLVFVACGTLSGQNVGDDSQSSASLDEMVVIRFFYHSMELDPYFELSPEAYAYNTETIPRGYWEKEFIRLMYAHTGISISRLWFDGCKLYVDLHENELRMFDHGSTGAYDRGIRLNRTLASLPGVASFEVLVDSERGAMTSHFSFNYIAIVEYGEIIRFDSF